MITDESTNVLETIPNQIITQLVTNKVPSTKFTYYLLRNNLIKLDVI
jgi:hypothetical protein